MSFNITKCNVLRITRRHEPIIFNYKLHGRCLEALDTTKYLGVHLSKDLRWNEHVRNISNKANKTLGFLKRNLRHCSKATKERAYKALVQPVVEYCSSVWDPFTAKNIRQVEMVQRRSARWVLSRYNRQDSVTDMLRDLGWRTLESRRTIARLTMLYKFRNKLAYIENSELKPVTYSSTRSSGHAYKIPNVKCDYFKYSFFPRTLQEWNKLPSHVALSKSLESYKGEISTIY